MKPLFTVKCSYALAKALGARSRVRLYRPNLSFPVYDDERTHHAVLDTQYGPLIWLWQLDGAHSPIEAPK